MKKLMLFAATALFFVSGLMAAPVSSWFVTGNDLIPCEKISIGINFAHVVVANGEKLKISLENIESYCSNGKVFNKMVLFKNGQSTNRSVFMQEITSRNGLSLYKNVEYDRDSTDPQKTHDVYYVYNGESLHLALNEKNMPNVFRFYGLKLLYR